MILDVVRHLLLIARDFEFHVVHICYIVQVHVGSAPPVACAPVLGGWPEVGNVRDIECATT